MKALLEQQANQIEAVLARHDAPGRVTGGIVTPRWVRFNVLPAMGAKVSTIAELSEQLAAALDVSAVQVTQQGAELRVEVPRDTGAIVELLPLLAGLRDVPEATAVLGLADDGVPLLIRLISPDVGHILVAGMAGSGKTALLRTMAWSLALHSAPPCMLLVGKALGSLAALPGRVRLALRPEETCEMLESLVRLMDQRLRAGERRPLVVVFVDDLSDLADGATAQLTPLLGRGQDVGIHLVAATRQHVDIARRFPVQIIGQVASAQEARDWLLPGAERLSGPGDFIALAEGCQHRFTAAYVDAGETCPPALGR